MTVLFKKCTYGLLLIATTIIGLINFGYCDIYNIYNNEGLSFRRISISNGQTISYSNPDGYVWCFQVDMDCNNNCGTITDDDGTAQLVGWGGNRTCTNRENISIHASKSIGFYYYLFFSEDLARHYFPNYTSLECQTEYNLIPISSVDQNYCVNNGFCPSSDCPDNPGTGGNRSALYINNIQYNGAPTIRVTIPEEIERDNYTDEEETTIDIIGYGYDQEKMQQMVNTQYYKPTAEEMSGLIEKIADFLPLVAVALLITRLRRVIKKVF